VSPRLRLPCRRQAETFDLEVAGLTVGSPELRSRRGLHRQELLLAEPASISLTARPLHRGMMMEVTDGGKRKGHAPRTGRGRTESESPPLRGPAPDRPVAAEFRARRHTRLSPRERDFAVSIQGDMLGSIAFTLSASSRRRPVRRPV
jgi:hypothetical protein